MNATYKTKSKFAPIPPEKVAAWMERNFPGCRTRRDGAEYTIPNPFRLGDDGNKFNVSVKGVCHDWRGDDWAPINPKTGRRSTGFVNFVRLYKKCSWQQALKDVLGQNSYLLQRPKEDEPEVVEHYVKLPSGAVPIVGSPHAKSAGMAIKWLAGRGVDLQLIERYDIHHTPSSDVVWPYYEYDSMVYWQSRSTIDKKFMFPPKSVADKDFFYGFDHAEPNGHVIITEAIFCTLTLGEQAMASGGAAMSERMVRKLRLLEPCDGVILAPDNDLAGLKSVLDNAPLIQAAGYKAYYSLPPKLRMKNGKMSKDWNDLEELMGKTEVRELMEGAITPFKSGRPALIGMIGSLPQ